MDTAQALAIVTSLANGIDPESGEVFHENSPYQRPQIIRALYEAKDALEHHMKRKARSAQLPRNTGNPWTEEEDRRLLSTFDAGYGVSELAAKHERTQTGIRARLVKYGRLSA